MGKETYRDLCVVLLVVAVWVVLFGGGREALEERAVLYTRRMLRTG